MCEMKSETDKAYYPFFFEGPEIVDLMGALLMRGAGGRGECYGQNNPEKAETQELRHCQNNYQASRQRFVFQHLQSAESIWGCRLTG